MHESGNRIKLPNGKIWGVAGAAGWTVIKTVKYDTPHILIPIDEISGLNSEEIGSGVLALLEEARFCQAQDYAETLLGDPGFEYLSIKDEELQKVINSAKDYLYEFQERDDNIVKCVALIEQYEEKQKNKKQLKAHKVKHRKIASANYERLFIKLGRKFGFKCLSCSSGDQLEVDHIKPVSIGGNTEFINLQLLCKSCNFKKGVQTIDYRPNE
ncbi:MAG: HNH endonuclease [Candidatus Marinimicrobia bacterium]|jgi:5-methylcytosine-specific restriction endonuclease McrA|nr:HNH endonuclease [Candidatus Neomarinimicrobiota bacterium]MBT7973614.1 HNH endonuclease [Candidatus Neomarinimicrobiota bacterium]